ncbi:phosphate uptake regulator PhoU [Candidatus Bathyarchaeota archaeon]|nr:phosphate uptake regulator PhoU [Candidatus Bathyarchaeota archaeon]
MRDISKAMEGEARKLQITGGSTYIISLPRKWVTRNQLRKGSFLILREEGDGSLSLAPSGPAKQEKKEEAIIRVSKKDESGAIRKAVSAYLVGYNLIQVRAQGQERLSSLQRNALKDFARRYLVGTEIVTDTPNELTLQILLSYPELTVESSLRRMSIITSSMHRDSMTALREIDHQLAKAVIDTDTEVDRFNLYIIRQLKLAIANPRIITEIGLSNARDCLGYRLITKSVERTADHAVSIAENVLMLKKRIDDEVLRKIENMSTLAISAFEDTIDSLFKHDFNLAESVIERAKEIAKLEKEAILLSQKIEIEEIASLRLLIESVRRTAEYASDIAEIVLNLNIESVLDWPTSRTKHI